MSGGQRNTKRSRQYRKSCSHKKTFAQQMAKYYYPTNFIRPVFRKFELARKLARYWKLDSLIMHTDNWESLIEQPEENPTTNESLIEQPEETPTANESLDKQPEETPTANESVIEQLGKISTYNKRVSFSSPLDKTQTTTSDNSITKRCLRRPSVLDVIFTYQNGSIETIKDKSGLGRKPYQRLTSQVKVSTDTMNNKGDPETTQIIETPQIIEKRFYNWKQDGWIQANQNSITDYKEDWEEKKYLQHPANGF